MNEYYPFPGIGYRAYHLVVKTLMFLQLFTMTGDLLKEETRHNAMLIGDDLTLVTGVGFFMHGLSIILSLTYISESAGLDGCL